MLAEGRPINKLSSKHPYASLPGRAVKFLVEVLPLSMGSLMKRLKNQIVHWPT